MTVEEINMEESVRNCNFCGAQTVTPYRCPECGYLFCHKHRLPEQHDCVARRKPSRGKRRAKRIGWVRRMSQLAIMLVMAGGALIILHVFGFVDLYEMIGRLRGLVARFT